MDYANAYSFIQVSQKHQASLSRKQTMKTLHPKLLLLCLSLTACEKEQAPDTAVIRPVRYTQVEQQNSTQSRTFTGVAQASLENTLSFRISGTVIKRLVKVGQQVKPGELIAALDPTDYQVAVKEARAGLASATAEARNAQANYRRVQGLYENRNAAKGNLDISRAQYESAQAGVNLAQQRLHAARLQLSYCELKSKDQCAVAALFVKKNENVAAGTPIVRLNCGDQPEVLVAVPGMFIDKVQLDEQVSIIFSALAGKQYQGVISEVGIAATQAATTFPVTTRILNPDLAIRSGMAADVTFETHNNGLGYIVPSVSVGEDKSGRFVFVLEPAGDGQYKAIRRPVKVGTLAANGLVIEQGLQTGELIATAGVRRIADGQIVTLLGKVEH